VAQGAYIGYIAVNARAASLINCNLAEGQITTYLRSREAHCSELIAADHLDHDEVRSSHSDKTVTLMQRVITVKRFCFAFALPLIVKHSMRK
jgi:hypothetical protein